jgi:7-cyano-7-deazaguanine synthase in queuosine biosynthesis
MSYTDDLIIKNVKSANSKPVVVSWTGGLDSTYLVWKLLSLGYRVNPVYVAGMQSEYQVMAEKQALKNLFQVFKEENTNIPVRLSDLFILQSGHYLRSDFILQQVPDILHGMGKVATFIDNSCCAIGYVMNDDAISYLDDIRAIWKTLGKFTKSGKFPPLIFPLKKVSKHQILAQLPEALLKEISFCEEPDLKDDHGKSVYKPCRECTSCKRMLTVTSRHNDHYKEVLKLKDPDPKSETRFADVITKA